MGSKGFKGSRDKGSWGQGEKGKICHFERSEKSLSMQPAINLQDLSGLRPFEMTKSYPSIHCVCQSSVVISRLIIVGNFICWKTSNMLV
jgi:hypothetical protein